MAYSSEDRDPNLYVKDRSKQLAADCDRLLELDVGHALTEEDVRAIRSVRVALSEACAIVLDMKAR